MIRKELKDEIEAITNRLDEKDPAERAVKTVLLTTVSAICVSQEVPLMVYVSAFTRRLARAIRWGMASQN